MILSEIKSIYFLGIGGIGMSALARYFHASGVEVGGYDKTKTSLTDELEKEGINIHFEDNVVHAPKSVSLVVYTPAIPRNNNIFRYYVENGYQLKKRSELLGMITAEHFTIAVAGTHGKTSTTAMIAHILKHAGKNCTAFVGGIMQNYNSNLLLTKNDSDDKIIVVEADEYDRSFLTLNPNISIITSMDADHLDIYGEKEHLQESFRLFAAKTKQGGVLIHKSGLETNNIFKGKNISYSVTNGADVVAQNIKISDTKYCFDISGTESKKFTVCITTPGIHNAENALAASTAANTIGITPEQIQSAFSVFKGVKRRFEYIVKSEEFIFIDDYAHHPEEIKAFLSAVKELYPNRKVTGIFQPHLFSRTRDFLNEFARSLETLDELILMEIYPAREMPIEGINSALLLEKVKIKNKILCSEREKLPELATMYQPEILVTIGAGDIDKEVEKLKKRLLKETT